MEILVIVGDHTISNKTEVFIMQCFPSRLECVVVLLYYRLAQTTSVSETVCESSSTATR